MPNPLYDWLDIKHSPRDGDRLARLEQAARECLKSRVATPAQRKAAGCVLELAGFVRHALEYRDPERAVDDAIELGIAWERITAAALWEPAETGADKGTFWRGSWVLVTERERQILDFVADESEVSLRDLCLDVWNDRYLYRENRGTLDMALSRLNSKLTKAAPPIDESFSVRGELVVFD